MFRVGALSARCAAVRARFDWPAATGTAFSDCSRPCTGDMNVMDVGDGQRRPVVLRRRDRMSVRPKGVSLMERLQERLRVAMQAFDTFQEVILDEPTSVERDAAIQRFEYTVEATWKACQRYLDVVHGIALGSPKGCIRHAREVGLMSDEDATRALMMIDDRNLTSHTYNEQLALEIYGRFPVHSEVLQRWLDSMHVGLERMGKEGNP